MKLYYSQTSPFARKVAMFLHFTGLIDQCELELTTFDTQSLRELNPLGKIPALVRGELVLFESDLICEYLDDLWCLEGNLSILNRGSQNYYLEQKAAAQANGVLEAAVSALFETRRETEQSNYWLERWHRAIEQGLNTIDLKNCGKADKPNMASFSLAAALGYLDFRHPQINWRAWNDELSTWFEKVREQDWFMLTAPPENA